ncbi:hypothetical protein Hdeb2414_s0020g00555211 [Helianthus debilis subsp. tardiflorus]
MESIELFRTYFRFPEDGERTGTPWSTTMYRSKKIDDPNQVLDKSDEIKIQSFR